MWRNEYSITVKDVPDEARLIIGETAMKVLSKVTGLDLHEYGAAFYLADDTKVTAVFALESDVPYLHKHVDVYEYEEEN